MRSLRRERGEGPRTLSIGLFMSLEMNPSKYVDPYISETYATRYFSPQPDSLFDDKLAQLVYSAVDAISKYAKTRSLRYFVGGGMRSGQNQPPSVERT